ncbi:MAG: DUF5683 domain-containing protein [Rikenellaceae bacterium]|nr:DUF5683 domain-containing protein [Rikenellaceae bacterium]
MKFRYLKILLIFFLVSSVTINLCYCQERGLVSGGVLQQEDKSGDTLLINEIRLQSPIFKDTMGLSRMSAISIVAPGFSQLYNKQYWKIPVLYGAVGGFSLLYVDANKNYKKYKRRYDDIRFTEGATRQQIDPVQTKMINYNTQRQVYMIGAAFTYLYFLGDGVINYPHMTTPAKRATTLAMIFPGAGQMYNKSYWKVPIVIGAFATMGYIIDFNSRGYNRFKEAYNRYPNDEFSGRYPQSTLQNLRDQYRRNRDLSIILTCAVYILSVVEAHVDAYMKDYDISDDLTLRVEPTLIDVSGLKASNGSSSGFGLAMRINF